MTTIQNIARDLEIIKHQLGELQKDKEEVEKQQCSMGESVSKLEKLVAVMEERFAKREDVEALKTRVAIHNLLFGILGTAILFVAAQIAGFFQGLFGR